MKRLLLFAFAFTLASCGLFSPPASEPAPVLVRGIPVYWHVATSQRQINQFALQPVEVPVLGSTVKSADGSCTIWLRSDAVHYAGVAAHEFGHCLALPADSTEQTASDYARLYLDTCGESVAPLGLPDTRKALCSEPPALDGAK